MHHFTPNSAWLGGMLIGSAATLLLYASGRIAGISGILSGLLLPSRGDIGWRAAFVIGLIAAGVGALLLAPERLGSAPRSVAALVGAGLLVGIGTRLSNGCTSGHGVCGISRLSPRSIAATATFVAAGIATVSVLRWLGIGS
jgi:uncharacterized membrane protein YedE/YeeE